MTFVPDWEGRDEYKTGLSRECTRQPLLLFLAFFSSHLMGTDGILFSRGGKGIISADASLSVPLSPSLWNAEPSKRVRSHEHFIHPSPQVHTPRIFP